MSEQKKSLSVLVIALSIVCVLLGSMFAVTLALYLPNEGKISEQQQTIDSLNQQIVNLEQQVANTPDISIYQNQNNELRTTLTALNNTLVSVNQQYLLLDEIVGLNKYSLIYTNTSSFAPESSIIIMNTQLNYAGYIGISVTSNSTTTYANVTYTFQDQTFEFSHILGESGTCIFPVLPALTQMSIGTNEVENGTQIEATVNYYY